MTNNYMFVAVLLEDKFELKGLFFDSKPVL